jgi:hypothetical protein
LRFWRQVCNGFWPELTCRTDMWTDKRRPSRRGSAFELAMTATLRGEKLLREGKGGVVPAFTCALRPLRQAFLEA